MHKIKSFWHWYVRGGIPESASISQLRKLQFINIIALLGFIVCLPFGVYDFPKYPGVGAIELVSGFIFLLAGLTLRFWRRPRLASSLIILATFILTIMLAATGGGDGAGIVWLVVFPPLIFFLEDWKASIIWVGLLLVVLAGLFFTGNLYSGYNNIFYQHTSYSIIVISIVVYFYQEINRQAERINEQTKHDLALSNAKLQQLNQELNITNTAIEQKVVERTKALVDEHAKLASSVDSLPVGVILVNKTEVMKINHIASKILSQDSNKKYSSKAIYDELGIAKSVNQSAKTRSQVVIDEHTFKNKLLRILIGPIVSEGEEAIGSVVVIEDITSLKALERSRDEFFLLASHELRTPLTVVEGNLSMMREQNSHKAHQKSEITEMLKDAYDASQRLSYIVNQLLEVAGYELGTVKLEKIEFDAVGLAEDVVHKFSQMAKDKKIKLDFSASKPILIKADPAKIEQVIDSLLDNAIRFTDAGKVSVEATTTDNHFVLTVSDSGRGLDKVAKANLFSTFQNNYGDLMTRNSSQNTGLGLYVSRLRMEKMGGSIKLAKTTLGKGSTFAIELPLAKRAK